eukprot:CAMPEP_0115328192 /NCGR_PEP_ID=MMETSP0270-20121206/84543_1 /TAXON_ID=71861 /ORGANISM="Scrippsiella trochoidea, Strain CCMP3099" /LENGTH=90 /DNA_ID=CAMNT_0002748685 /DNA_START=32 /DNA_END=301 /DNA_ORIENTATION=+
MVSLPLMTCTVTRGASKSAGSASTRSTIGAARLSVVEAPDMGKAYICENNISSSWWYHVGVKVDGKGVTAKSSGKFSISCRKLDVSWPAG